MCGDLVLDVCGLRWLFVQKGNLEGKSECSGTFRSINIKDCFGEVECVMHLMCYLSD